jgi:hypothetical protein
MCHDRGVVGWGKGLYNVTDTSVKAELNVVGKGRILTEETRGSEEPKPTTRNERSVSFSSSVLEDSVERRDPVSRILSIRGASRDQRQNILRDVANRSR